MAYDQRLADDIRSRIGNHPDVTEKEMFGGIAFMIGGNMAVGVSGDELMVRSATKPTTKQSPSRAPGSSTSPPDPCEAGSSSLPKDSPPTQHSTPGSTKASPTPRPYLPNSESRHAHQRSGPQPQQAQHRGQQHGGGWARTPPAEG